MKKEIKIGLFGLLILFLLYWGINFLKGRDIFNRTTTLYAYYENVSGIQVSSPILIKGINAGAVTKVTFKPEMENFVELQINIKSGYKIPDNSVAQIVSNGIIGGKAMEIELGDSDRFLTNGSTIMASSESSFFEMAGSEFDYFKKKAGQLITEIQKVMEGINGILGASGDDIKDIIENLNSLSKTLEKQGDNIAGIVGDIDSFTTMLADNSGKIDNVITNLEDFSGNLSEADIAATVDNLSATLENLNAALEKVNDPEGNIGLLLNDRQFYDSLTEASENLANLLGDLKENPRRYVHFSLFGGKKAK